MVKYNHDDALRRLAIAKEQGGTIYPTWKNQNYSRCQFARELPHGE
jgi:hypothetical protein